MWLTSRSDLPALFTVLERILFAANVYWCKAELYMQQLRSSSILHCDLITIRWHIKKWISFVTWKNYRRVKAATESILNLKASQNRNCKVRVTMAHWDQTTTARFQVQCLVPVCRSPGKQKLSAAVALAFWFLDIEWNALRQLWIKRSKRSKIYLPSLERHVTFCFNPKASFESSISSLPPEAFITSRTTTNPNTLARLFQCCHLYPASCQNLQLFSSWQPLLGSC